jgi:hypothetical protein
VAVNGDAGNLARGERQRGQGRRAAWRHRNTLHQRIQRIEKLTSYPISHPQFHPQRLGRFNDLAYVTKPFTGTFMKIINARLRHKKALYTIEL